MVVAVPDHRYRAGTEIRRLGYRQRDRDHLCLNLSLNLRAISPRAYVNDAIHAPFPRHVDVIGLIDTVIECFGRTRFAKSCAIHDG
jgi:hypothetical protein